MRKCSLFEAIRMFFVGVKSGIFTAYGVLKMGSLPRPIIAVFGGRGAYEGGKYALLAQQLGKRCAQEGMSIITGGGPGIMEAANCGAFEVAGKKNTLGIGVRGVDLDFDNECAPLVRVDYFFDRKWLLTRYSAAFVLFPGGIGTMDEFFEVLNLMKLKKMDKVPIILFGTTYWKSLIEWYHHAFEYDFIALAPQNAFVVTDDVEEAVRVIITVTKTKGES